MAVVFENRGVVQKKDPSQLGPGEFYQLENAWSQQEGALTSRTGHQRLTPSPLGSPIHSISKLNLGKADSNNPRYLGSGSSIFRTNSSYAETSVYSGLTSGVRWSAQQYNAGTAGTPALYFSTTTAALRDNGTYTTLQKWGIDPPPVPAQASLDVGFSSSTSLIPSGGVGFTTRFIAGVNSDGSGYKTLTAIGVGPGYTRITPTAGGTILGVNGIYVGMSLTITDSTAGNENIIVLAVDSDSCYGVTTLNHNSSPIGNVKIGYVQNVLTVTAAAAPGSSEFVFQGFSIDASYNGTAETGYDTDDPFHIGLQLTDITNVTKLQIILVPNFTGTPLPNATDYYEYDVYPAVSMSAGSTNSPSWYEVNIPKNSFKKIGNAGAGAFTWKNIQEIYVIANYTAAPTSPLTFSLGISSIYFTGGGGLNSASAGTTNYDWMYVYRNPSTKAVGNPSPLMIPANLLPPISNGKVTLTLTGTAQDPSVVANGISEISGPGSIKIYRRGGTFADGLWRHVGYAANPGSGATVIFVDNAADSSLNTADTLEFDNDPPVPSSLPTPLTANIYKFQPNGGGADYNTSSEAHSGSATSLTTNAVTRLVLSSLPTNFVAANIAFTITIGSTVSVGFGNTFEQCIISAVGYGTGSDSTSPWIEVWLQYNHKTTANDPSETIECDAVLRGNCDLLYQDFDCVFLAGDTNNPATLYQSKVGRPESFPVANLENGFVQQINVGSPSNPIYGITGIGPGELVCLNLDNIFIVQVWAGQMQQPIKAPASRGLYSKWCWCKGDNRLWYLAYDGIYTWAGGESQKVSEQIDYLFKKQTVNGIPPIDMTQALKFSFTYAENSLYVTVIDVNGVYKRLRYETLYNRWTVEVIYAAATGATSLPIDCLFTEPDTGNFLVSIRDSSSQAYLWLSDFYSTTDGWKIQPNDGTEIQYTAWRYWPIADPTADYQIGEVMLEMMNPADSVSMQLFYNYAISPTNTIAISGGTLPMRGRLFSTVNSGESGVVQYSIGIKLTGATGSNGLSTFYTFDWRNFPWSDAGYPGPKTFGWLNIQVNTNGVAVPMELQIDGATAYAFTVNGTFWNRANTITLPSNITGIQYRVVPSTGYSGTFQLYGVEPKFERLPMQLTHWDSLSQVYGSVGWRYIWQCWIDYQSSVPLLLSIYRDADVLFYQVTLPAHTQRDVARFYVPAVNTPAGGGSPQFNKSQTYRLILDSSDGITPYQLYRDGSRIETLNLDGDQRSGFEQHVIWTNEPVQAI